MKTEEKIFIVPDFMVVLMVMNDNPGTSVSDMHYKSQITYSHLHLIKKMFVRKEWITITVDGRKHIPSLTVEGEIIVKNILSLLDSMNITKEEVYEYKLKEKRKGPIERKVTTTVEEIKDTVIVEEGVKSNV